MNTVIAELIHSSRGYCYETAGVIMCFFNDAAQARYCANVITATVGKTAEVCGSQLSISL